MGKKIIVYTDASYDPDLQIAACGYVTLVDTQMNSHNVYMVSKLENINDAERYAILLALRDLPQIQMFDQIFINTDCLVCTLSSFQKKQTSTLISEVRKEIGRLAKRGVSVKVNHVYAHNNNHFNCMIDMSCRAHLRKHRTEIKGISQTSGLKPSFHNDQS